MTRYWEWLRGHSQNPVMISASQDGKKSLKTKNALYLKGGPKDSAFCAFRRGGQEQKGEKRRETTLFARLGRISNQTFPFHWSLFRDMKVCEVY